MCFQPCLYGDYVCLRGCMHVCKCLYLYCGCAAFICVSGHVCMAIGCVRVNVCMLVTVCACVVVVLCLYVSLAMCVC